MTPIEIGQRIKRRRKAFKITQEDFCELIGVSRKSLVTIERGQGNPTLRQLIKISEALKLKVFVD
ncbi:MAG: helix-turn-helix domain-containing protein [Chitinophagales bacterium]